DTGGLHRRLAARHPRRRARAGRAARDRAVAGDGLVNILFICNGKLCRSPVAEALARKMLELRGRPDIAVHSAGTAAAVGSPASEGAYLVGMEKGLDLSSHSARQL